MWTPNRLTLAWPIKGDKQEQITELTFKPLTRASHIKALEGDDPKERVIFEKLATLSCGLSASEFTRLALPDCNSIKRIISDYVSLSTPEMYKRAGKEFNKNSPQLLVPITGDNGDIINHIDLKIPTVQVSDIMDSLPEKDRNDYITQDVTGLSQTELNRLATQDWNYTQERISDFLQQTADYFQDEILK
ncbi:hypothetical protein [Shewanella frigidimarina]|uniref:hypothetical protein n=1 Tax=Shewanella frigidimarina TaxID=56812 RepID=UPI003D7BE822